MLRALGIRIGYGAGTGLATVTAVRDEARWAARVDADAAATDLRVVISARTEHEREEKRAFLASTLGSKADQPRLSREAS